MTYTVKKDCVNYRVGGCVALKETMCGKEICKFYKNQTILDNQIAKIRKRIPNYGMDKRDEYCY